MASRADTETSTIDPVRDRARRARDGGRAVAPLKQLKDVTVAVDPGRPQVTVGAEPQHPHGPQPHLVDERLQLDVAPGQDDDRAEVGAGGLRHGRVAGLERVGELLVPRAQLRQVVIGQVLDARGEARAGEQFHHVH